VDEVSGKIYVKRGVRNTTAASHDFDADVYVGLYTRRDIRLVFHDGYARDGGGGR
jgi:hypothetical protein